MKTECVPIGVSLQLRLEAAGRSAAWLAESAQVERSTTSRILSGERKRPTAETLDRIASAFGISLAELVKGTDAEDRMVNEERSIPKSAFDEVMAQMLRYEREGIELRGRMREREDTCRETERALGQAKRANEQLHRQLLATEQEKFEARRELAQRDEEVQRYRSALEQAFAHVGALKGQLGEAAKKIDDTRFTSQVTGLLAAVSTMASVGAYLAATSTSPKPTKKSTSKKKVSSR